MNHTKWEYAEMIVCIFVAIMGSSQMFFATTYDGMEELWEEMPDTAKLKTAYQAIFGDLTMTYAIGGYVTLIGCFGIYAAYESSAVLLKTYWALSALGDFFESVMFFFTLMLQAYRMRSTKEGLIEVMVMYSDDEKNSNNRHMNTLQNRLNCCGIVNYGDWMTHLGYIPSSCCSSTGDRCPEALVQQRQGCLVPVTNIYMHYLYAKNRLIVITIILLIASFLINTTIQTNKLQQVTNALPSAKADSSKDRNIAADNEDDGTSKQTLKDIIWPF